MINKLVKMNMWYDNLAHTRKTVRFLIFMLIMVIVFALPQPFQILTLLNLLAFRLLANYVQKDRLQKKLKEKNYAVQ